MTFVRTAFLFVVILASLPAAAQQQTQQQNPIANQIEQRLKNMIGDLIVQNTALSVQLELARAEIEQLQKKLPGGK